MSHFVLGRQSDLLSGRSNRELIFYGRFIIKNTMIDFLPTPEKRMFRKEYHLRVLSVFLCMTAFVFILAILSYLPTYFITNSRYNESMLTSQSPETKDKMSQAKEVEAAVTETNKKIATLLADVSTVPLKDVFFDALQNRPPGIILVRLSYDQGGVASKKGKEEVLPPVLVLEGTSPDRQALLLFKDNLSRKKEFSAVDLPLSSLVKETNLTFSIRVTLSSNVAGG